MLCRVRAAFWLSPACCPASASTLGTQIRLLPCRSPAVPTHEAVGNAAAPVSSVERRLGGSSTGCSDMLPPACCFLDASCVLDSGSCTRQRNAAQRRPGWRVRHGMACKAIDGGGDGKGAAPGRAEAAAAACIRHISKYRAGGGISRLVSAPQPLLTVGHRLRATREACQIVLPSCHAGTAAPTALPGPLKSETGTGTDVQFWEQGPNRPDTPGALPGFACIAGADGRPKCVQGAGKRGTTCCTHFSIRTWKAKPNSIRLERGTCTELHIKHPGDSPHTMLSSTTVACASSASQRPTAPRSSHRLAPRLHTAGLQQHGRQRRRAGLRVAASAEEGACNVYPPVVQSVPVLAASH